MAEVTLKTVVDEIDLLGSAIEDNATTVCEALAEVAAEIRENRFVYLDTINGDPPGHAYNLWFIANELPTQFEEAERQRRGWLFGRAGGRERTIATLERELQRLQGPRGLQPALSQKDRDADAAIEAKKAEIAAKKEARARLLLEDEEVHKRREAKRESEQADNTLLIVLDLMDALNNYIMSTEGDQSADEDEIALAIENYDACEDWLRETHPGLADNPVAEGLVVGLIKGRQEAREQAAVNA